MKTPAAPEPALRRDATRTKAAILEAAGALFSDRGYAQAGIRDIAQRAGINSALVLRYFGSKEQLFEAALMEALHPDVLFDTPRERFGEHVVRKLMELEGQSPNPLSMVALALGEPQARAVASRLIREQVIVPLSRWLGAPQAESRAARIAMLCSGFRMYCTLAPFDPQPLPLEAEAQAWLANILQGIVDQIEDPLLPA